MASGRSRLRWTFSFQLLMVVRGQRDNARSAASHCIVFHFLALRWAGRDWEIGNSIRFGTSSSIQTPLTRSSQSDEMNEFRDFVTNVAAPIILIVKANTGNAASPATMGTRQRYLLSSYFAPTYCSVGLVPFLALPFFHSFGISKSIWIFATNSNCGWVRSDP